VERQAQGQTEVVRVERRELEEPSLTNVAIDVGMSVIARLPGSVSQ
jgi:hypothetical protein